MATLLTLPLLASLLSFWTLTRGQAQLVLKHELLPQVYLSFLAFSFLLPIQQLSRSGRYRFLSTLRRVSVGGLAQAQDGKFGDILLADVLTSYSKVLGDLFVSACMFFAADVSSTGKPNRGCGGHLLVPFILSIPSMIRLRQCLIEYYRVKNSGDKSGGWGGQHLANALKYSTALPVILLGALQKGYNPSGYGVGQVALNRLW